MSIHKMNNEKGQSIELCYWRKLKSIPIHRKGEYVSGCHVSGRGESAKIVVWGSSLSSENVLELATTVLIMIILQIT